MEHISYVRQSAFHGISVDKARTRYKDALGLPFHLDATYLHPSGHTFTGCLSYLPFNGHLGVCDYAFEPAFVRKRNERERHRVRCVNEGYARLREHLPKELDEKRLSKVETLRAAIGYIKHLQSLLEFHGSGLLEFHGSGLETPLGDVRSQKAGSHIERNLTVTSSHTWLGGKVTENY